MDIQGMPILTLIVFLPLVGSIVVLFNRERMWVQTVSLVTALLSFITTLIPFWVFKSDVSSFQMQELIPWITSLGISYHLGIDGLSLFLLPLTSFLTVACILISWNHIKIKEQLYFVMFLWLEVGVLGVFVALDVFLFYIFWEVMLIPMFLIILIWGSDNRRYAAVKFLIYTMAGSVFMLIAIIVMAFLNQNMGSGFGFDLVDWIKLDIPFNLQAWLFVAFFVAFAIKVPLFPFHTWLPDAHVQAPTAGSAILAGILLKMGIYGMLRFCYPLFPEAVVYFTPTIIVLGLVGVIYGAFLAFAQTDLKKLVAYSSISHMGLIVVGIFALNATGIKGGIIQMVNHGLSTGALFILVGALYERTHTRDMDKLGGLATRVPVLATFFMIIVLSSIGLPGMNGFVGEVLLLLGAFKYKWWVGGLGATTLILGAVYMLWMYQRVMFEKERSCGDLIIHDFCLREKIVMVPIVLLIFFIGLFPSFFLDKMDTSANKLLSYINNSPAVVAMVDNDKVIK
ncbi:MAG: NADH-quinone oxidoreductase subunit M [Deltaproteobacteria bacterium]|nr:NADH-quinone oxidoreductase subunit M [Deltaproteobacteria bacterium]